MCKLNINGGHATRIEAHTHGKALARHTRAFVSRRELDWCVPWPSLPAHVSNANIYIYTYIYIHIYRERERERERMRDEYISLSLSLSLYTYIYIYIYVIINYA